MPKVIKKRPGKKKSLQENEVKSAALQALDVLKERQRHIMIAVSVVAAVIILYIIFALYSSSMNKKAYALEKEAGMYYYGTEVDKNMTREDRWKKALELYQKAIDVKATPTAVFYLGNCYFNLGDYGNAIKQYHVFIDKFSGNKGILPLVYQKLTSAYFKGNQNEEALETLSRLSALENGVFRDTALIFEARHYEHAGEKDKALEKYRELMTEFPLSPWSIEAAAKVDEEEAKKTEEPTEESEVKKGEEAGGQPQEPAKK